MSEVVRNAVIARAVRTYRALGYCVFVDAWADEATESRFDVVIDDLRQIEEVVVDLDQIDLHKLAAARAGGYSVWVLVPLGRLADARRVLRGIADRVQAFVFDGDRVCFEHAVVP